MFTDRDLQQIEDRGIDWSEIEKQIVCLKEKTHFTNVVRPAIYGDGIICLSEEEIKSYVSSYDEKTTNKKILKFVPASGAATRMFKNCFEFLEKGTDENATTIIKNIKKLPFYFQLSKDLENRGYDIKEILQNNKYKSLISFMLSKNGLNYGSKPKALLYFHKYDDEIRTSFEEHWVEGAAYALSEGNKVNLHFTVSPEHESEFREISSNLKKKYEQKYNLTYNVDFSIQSHKTDTVSLDGEGNLFRDEEGAIVFRPGGHGSLLYNLNCIDADVVFVKNIDNVTIDSLKEDTYTYKKCLLGILLDLQDKCFEYLRLLDSGKDPGEEIDVFLKDKLNICFPENYNSLPKKEKQIFRYNKMNRPIRVCGMVKRENEPGGGPFWVRSANGELSLQIVETSEIDMSDAAALHALESSSFFNPVDLVCGLKNYKGDCFDLKNYVDNSRYFIAAKSLNGKNIKVLEHPGLWNGSMSDWNTLFVSVPLSTFTPVKTLNDLLRNSHCNE